VFLPMLFYVAGAANALAGHPDEGVRLLAVALEASGAGGYRRLVFPELTLMHGDMLAATGAVTDAVAAWRAAADNSRDFGIAMTELRALTRLVGAAQGEERTRLVADLGVVYAGFDEGLDTADLRAAGALLAG
jgi:hypothetical protein